MSWDRAIDIAMVGCPVFLRRIREWGYFLNAKQMDVARDPLQNVYFVDFVFCKPQLLQYVFHDWNWHTKPTTTRRKWTGGTKVLIQWNVLQNAVDVRYCQHICHQRGSFQWKQCLLQVICTKHDICHYNMLGFQLFCDSYVGGYGIIDPDGERNGARWQPFLFVPFWNRTFLIEVPGPGLEFLGITILDTCSLHPGKLKNGTYLSPMKRNQHDLNQTSMITHDYVPC